MQVGAGLRQHFVMSPGIRYWCMKYWLMQRALHSLLEELWNFVHPINTPL